MSEELKKRAKKSSPDVIALCAGVPQVLETRHAIRQVIRSSRSVAANYRSASRGKSNAEFISTLGTLIDRVHRELTDADLKKITSTYQAWRGDGLAQRRRDAEKKNDSENLRASASPREYLA